MLSNCCGVVRRGVVSAQEVTAELYGVDDTFPGLPTLLPPDAKVKEHQTSVVTAALSRNLARAFVAT